MITRWKKAETFAQRCAIHRKYKNKILEYIISPAGQNVFFLVRLYETKQTLSKPKHN